MKTMTLRLDRLIYEPGTPPTRALVKNLQTYGQQMPILVQPNGDDRFVLLDGRRRVQGLKKLGVEEVTAIVVGGDVSGPVLTLIAQFHRSPNPVAEARALREIVATGVKQADLPVMLNVSKALVRQRLQLLTRLHPGLLAKIEEGSMPVSAGRIAVQLPDKAQDELATRERVYLKDVEALARADKLALLDLDAIDVPDTPAYTVLAAQLSVVAHGLTGKHKQVLLEATRVLESLGRNSKR